MMKLYFSYNLLFLSWLPKVVLNRKLIQLQMMQLQNILALALLRGIN